MFSDDVILTFGILPFIIPIKEEKEKKGEKGMEDIDLDELDNQSLMDLQAILEGMNEVLKEEEGENNE